MTRKIIAILLLLVLLIPLFTITSEAVYNVTIGNGSISPSIQSPSGSNYTNGGTDAFIIRYKKVVYVLHIHNFCFYIILIYFQFYHMPLLYCYSLYKSIPLIQYLYYYYQ